MTADGAIRGASAAFRDYLTEVGRDLAAGNATEHTHRPALKALLIALDPDVRPVNEPRRIECGAPDFIVTRNDLPVGYIEAKDVGRSLDEIERDEQLKRYRESLSNLILTDYLEFRWYKDGEKQGAARIAYVGDSGKLRPDREGQRHAAAMFSSFLAQEPPIVGKPEDLAKRMAALTRIVRDIVQRALEHDRSGGSPLREQLEGFRRVLIHDLGEEQFADMYAQTIAYGLFAARVNAPADEHFSRQHAAYDLPKTNPFLRQMFGQIAAPSSTSASPGPSTTSPSCWPARAWTWCSRTSASAPARKTRWCTSTRPSSPPTTARCGSRAACTTRPSPWSATSCAASTTS